MENNLKKEVRKMSNINNWNEILKLAPEHELLKELAKRHESELEVFIIKYLITILYGDKSRISSKAPRFETIISKIENQEFDELIKKIEAQY